MKNVLIILFLFIVNSSLYAQKKVISVTIEPQKFILQKIAKNKVKIKSIFKGSDFNVKFKKLAFKEISDSDLYMTIGLDLEKDFLTNIKKYNPKLEVFDMSLGINKIKTKTGRNPYIWTDPLIVRDISRKVFMKLSEMDSKNRKFYKNNYEIFLKELDDLYLKIQVLFQNSSFAIYAFDNYWDYYVERFHFPTYKIKKRILKAEEISSFIYTSRKRNIEVVLVDKKTPLKIANSIASNSVSQVVHSDIFNYTFLTDLYLLGEKLAKK